MYDSMIPDEWAQLLCPPGNGVFTVQTASERKAILHQLLYGTIDSKDVERSWLQNMATPNKVALLGIPSDCGGGIVRGSNWGPLFVRNEFYQSKQEVWELGDVRVIPHLLHDKYLNETTIQNCRLALYENSESTLPVSPLSMVERIAQQFGTKFPDSRLIAIGGDHSVSYPLTKAWLQTRSTVENRVGIIHFDAHTDLLESRLGIDICFGTWTYQILPFLKSPSDLVQIGIRSSGKDKKYWEGNLGIKQFWQYELEKSGPGVIASEICERFKQAEIQEVYISFDIDSLDVSCASCTGTPETDGLEVAQCVDMLNIFGEQLNITGADLVEVAPFTQPNLPIRSDEPDATVASAKQILSTLVQILS